jgi:hypothetical protein
VPVARLKAGKERERERGTDVYKAELSPDPNRYAYVFE